MHVRTAVWDVNHQAKGAGKIRILPAPASAMLSLQSQSLWHSTLEGMAKSRPPDDAVEDLHSAQRQHKRQAVGVQASGSRSPSSPSVPVAPEATPSAVSARQATLEFVPANCVTPAAVSNASDRGGDEWGGPTPSCSILLRGTSEVTLGLLSAHTHSGCHAYVEAPTAELSLLAQPLAQPVSRAGVVASLRPSKRVRRQAGGSSSLGLDTSPACSMAARRRAGMAAAQETEPHRWSAAWRARASNPTPVPLVLAHAPTPMSLPWPQERTWSLCNALPVAEPVLPQPAPDPDSNVFKPEPLLHLHGQAMQHLAILKEMRTKVRGCVRMHL